MYEKDITSFKLEQIPVPVVYTTHRIIRDCNSEFAALFGYSREDLIKTSFANLYPKHADFVRTGQLWRTHLSGGKIYYDERVMTARDGRRFWCQVHGRSGSGADPLAQAVYCFQPLTRPVADLRVTLTNRQRQILALVAQGKTNAEIAAEVGLSKRTVESHRARFMKANGLRNGAELSAWFASPVEGERR